MQIPDDASKVLETQGVPAGTYDWQPASTVEKYIARRLTDAARDIPTFPLDMHIDLGKMKDLRTAMAAEGATISLNDLMVKAAAWALLDVPAVNRSFTSQGFAQHRSADIAVAMATSAGLMTPIVRGADHKGVSEIAAEIKDLADRAERRKLQASDYIGGTFSISNLGMFGIPRFASIINPPHAAILSIGAMELRRVLDKKGEEAAKYMATVVLTCDHRVIDGVTGARWLGCFRDYVEAPGQLLGPHPKSSLPSSRP